MERFSFTQFFCVESEILYCSRSWYFKYKWIHY